MRLSMRLYRALLKLYPAGFRERFAAPLQQDFRDEYATVRSRRDAVRLWRRTVADYVRSMPIQVAREFRQDARHAFRVWRAHPLPTVFAIVVLALAIGANTGVFSVLNALLLRSLPFHEPERLATLRMFSPPGLPDSPAAFHAWRQQSPYLEDAATFVTSEVTLDELQGTHRLRLTETSWNFFNLLGARPAPGRGFTPEEDAPGKSNVAIISRGLWAGLFGEDPRAIGAAIRLNGSSFTIIGIAPPAFDYPQKTQVWTPTTFDLQRVSKTGVVFWTTIGRLRGNVTWTQARGAFESEAYQRSPERRTADAINRPALTPLREQLAGPVKQASLLLMAGVGLLLLLACTNVANLLLSRTVARSTELVIRTVLGASRARLIQQLLTESVLLSAIAALAGLVVAVWTAAIAGAAQPAQLSSQSYSILDWRVLLFAIAVACAAAILFGIGPVFYLTRLELGAPSRSATAGPRHTRMRMALLTIQTAVTIVLLAGSLALGRAFIALLRVDNGYDITPLTTLSVSFVGTSYESAAQKQTYYAIVRDRLRSVPGVTAISATESLPLDVDSFMGGRFTLDRGGPESPMTTVTLVAPDFFSTIGGRVLFGREFTSGDLNATEPMAVVNEELAREIGNPATIVGHLLTAQRGAPRRIVGVVRGVRYGGPTAVAYPQAFYVSKSPGTLTLVVRVAGDAHAATPLVRDAVQSVDPKIPVFNVKTMEERLDATLARPKFYATAVAFFGGVALLLSLVGMYGMVSCGVTQRARELGIRLALGTTPTRLRSWLLRRMWVPVWLGVLPGAALVIAMQQVMAALIVGADAAVAGVAATAVLVTTGVATAAIWTATRQITRLDVLDVIRADSGE